jgi:hypothetical protein
MVTAANFVNYNRGNFVGEQVNVINGQPLADEHIPTVIGSVYNAFVAGRVIYSLALNIQNPFYVGSRLFLVGAVPVARISGSQTAETVAAVAVDLAGAALYAQSWIVARSLHYCAGKVADYVPSGNTWGHRAIKDIADIATRELANAGTALSQGRATSTQVAAKGAEPKLDMKLVEEAVARSGVPTCFPMVCKV